MENLGTSSQIGICSFAVLYTCSSYGENMSKTTYPDPETAETSFTDFPYFYSDCSHCVFLLEVDSYWTMLTVFSVVSGDTRWMDGGAV